MAGPVVVEARSLTKVYRDFWGRQKKVALNALNLKINQGEIFGLLGPNGSGKTTTIKLLLGLLFPTNGDALVFDNPPTARELLFHHVAAGDANGDGRLDLFVTGYQNSRSGLESFNVFNATGGQRDLLFINQGGLKFTEEGPARGIKDARYGYVARPSA